MARKGKPTEWMTIKGELSVVIGWYHRDLGIIGCPSLTSSILWDARASI